jgi:predicted signal transduction protein with EAL and GGDEF domain
MKSLHTVNCVLFILNAVLWAVLAKQPGIAVVWLAVGLGELYVIKNTDFYSY